MALSAIFEKFVALSILKKSRKTTQEEIQVAGIWEKAWMAAT
ncbi:hypothetical protein TRICHSKD4_4574 [Roseibium sp. TrichSKD4]|nr:hypothetical protein [Roseibium sp. TrichSKD4]EFO30973.1 hypothetical protein TRICHSKD4_4574 [Roseibium sp. TrichSKD4]